MIERKGMFSGCTAVVAFMRTENRDAHNNVVRDDRIQNVDGQTGVVYRRVNLVIRTSLYILLMLFA